jgi:hypothetical protein
MALAVLTTLDCRFLLLVALRAIFEAIYNCSPHDRVDTATTALFALSRALQ